MSNVQDVHRLVINDEENSINPTASAEQQHSQLYAQLFGFCGKSTPIRMVLQCVNTNHQLSKPAPAGGSGLLFVKPAERVVHIPFGCSH